MKTSPPSDVPSIGRPTILAIDLMRGLFAIFVLIAHSWEFGMAGDYGVHEGRRAWWEYLITPGTFWVTGFFVLSGFCIALSVFRSIGRDSYTLSSYLKARLTRIYPLFLIGLLLAVIAWFFADRGAFPGRQFLITVFNCQNLVQDGAFPWYGASWSITNEVLYYLIFPVALVLGRKKMFGSLVATAAIFVVISGVLAFLWITGIYPTTLWTIFMSGLNWCIGVAALWLFCRPGFAGISTRGIGWLALVVLVIAFSIRTYLWYSDGRAMLLQFNSLLGSVGFGFLVVWLRETRFPTEGPWVRVATWSGLLSYPLYLFHIPVHGYLKAAYTAIGPDTISRPVAVLIAIVVPLIFAGTIGVWLEKWFLNRRKLWLRGRPSIATDCEQQAATPVAR